MSQALIYATALVTRYPRSFRGLDMLRLFSRVAPFERQAASRARRELEPCNNIVVPAPSLRASPRAARERCFSALTRGWSHVNAPLFTASAVEGAASHLS